MARERISTDSSDIYDLNRFVEAQVGDFEQALSEIRAGQKRSHWMWYIFPQFAGLGFSSTSQHYAIKSVAEVRAYLDHPLLGPRLIEAIEAVLGVKGRSAVEIFGATDAMKLQSCATLFASVAPAGSVFELLLDRYYHGERDRVTLGVMSRE